MSTLYTSGTINYWYQLLPKICIIILCLIFSAVHLVLLREEVNADVSPNKSDTRVSFVKLTYWYHVALSLTMFLWVYKCPVSLWTMWLSILLPCQLLLPGILLFSPTTPRETPLAIPVQPEQD